MASPPVRAKEIAALTLGSMEPGAKWPSVQYCSACAIVISSSEVWSGLPQLIATRSTAVRMTSASAWTSSASLAEAKSWDAAAADGDHDEALIHQRVDHVLFNHVHGLGGGNDAAIAATRILYEGITLLSHDLVSSLFIVERADRLGRMLEGGIVFLHQDLRHDGGNVLLNAAGSQLVADRILQVVADVALAHRAALGERHVGLDGAGFSSRAHAEVDHTDLRAVAVGDDDLVTLLDQIDDGLGGLYDQLQLFVGSFAQSVAAQSDDDAFAHSFHTSFQ